MTAQPMWLAVDEYLMSTLGPEDQPLREALAASERAGLPPIQVSAAQGRVLMLLAMAVGAKRILEVGTLGGYSTIWLARGLSPGGSITTLEIDPHHAALAQRNIAGAGFQDRVEVLIGRALDSLHQLRARVGPPFDMVFIDADKESTAAYVNAAADMTRPGGLIVVDNVVREGEVVNAHSTDSRVQGVRAGLARLGSHPRLVSGALQVVGSKGYDGLAMAVVRSA